MDAVAQFDAAVEEEIAAQMTPESEAPEPETGDQPEPAEPDADEPEASHEPQRAKSSETQMLEREKKLKSEDTRHENALKKIWGDEFAEKAYCPCCLGQGFMSPWPAGAMPEEVWEAVKALSGQLDTHALRIPDEYVVCERCAGAGMVGTPATNEHSAAIPCKLCDSRGYFDLSDAVQAAKLRGPVPAPEPFTPTPFTQWPDLTPAAPVQVISPPDGWAAAGKPGADTYGRWPGHPRFGIDPSVNGGQW